MIYYILWNILKGGNVFYSVRKIWICYTWKSCEGLLMGNGEVDVGRKGEGEGNFSDVENGF